MPIRYKNQQNSVNAGTPVLLSFGTYSFERHRPGSAYDQAHKISRTRRIFVRAWYTRSNASLCNSNSFKPHILHLTIKWYELHKIEDYTARWSLIGILLDAKVVQSPTKSYNICITTSLVFAWWMHMYISIGSKVVKANVAQIERAKLYLT